MMNILKEEWCSRGVHFSLVRSEMGELGDGLSAMEGGVSGTSYTQKPTRLIRTSMEKCIDLLRISHAQNYIL